MDGDIVHTLQRRIQIWRKRAIELLVDIGGHDGNKARLNKQKWQWEDIYGHASFCIKGSIVYILEGPNALAYHSSFLFIISVTTQKQEEKQKKSRVCYL